MSESGTSPNRPMTPDEMDRLFDQLFPSLKAKLAVFALVIVAAALFGRFVCYPGMESSSRTEAPRPRDARVGDVTTLQERAGGAVPVAPTLDDLDRLYQLNAASDSLGIERMIRQGRLWTVPSGTQCRILRRRLSGYELRILDGSHTGETGYVPDVYVAQVVD